MFRLVALAEHWPAQRDDQVHNDEHFLRDKDVLLREFSIV